VEKVINSLYDGAVIVCVATLRLEGIIPSVGHHLVHLSFLNTEEFEELDQIL
jgi:hypothetical protein